MMSRKPSNQLYPNAKVTLISNKKETNKFNFFYLNLINNYEFNRWKAMSNL